MNKFVIAEIPKETEIDNLQPVLYKVHIGTRYYLHKGKILKDSLDRLLDDVFRGMRELKYNEQYSLFVEYCMKYPSVHKVFVELVYNGNPSKLIKLEAKLYKEMNNDELSLNRLDIAPYKPEWMLKQSFQERCSECIVNGVIETKKTKFRFCPNCGRLNK